MVKGLSRALQLDRERKLEEINWVTDREYCYNARTEELDVWGQNGSVNAKKKPLKQQTIWQQIDKLRKEIS